MCFQKLLVVYFWSMLVFDNISGGYGEVRDLFELLKAPSLKAIFFTLFTFLGPGPLVTIFCFFNKFACLETNPFIIKKKG